MERDLHIAIVGYGIAGISAPIHLACSTPPFGAPVRRITARTIEERSLLDLNYGDAIAGEFALGIQRGTLHQLLASADAGKDAVLSGCGIGRTGHGMCD